MWRETDRFENWFVTTLETDVNDTTTTFRIGKILQVDNARLIIDPCNEDHREIVRVTGKDGNLVTVIRGDDHTDPEYHLAGTLVACNVTAGDLNDLLAEWDEFSHSFDDLIADAEAATASAVAAASAANTAKDNAITATTNAITATTNANTAKDNAIIATTNANNATSSANTAAVLANTAKDNAITATNNANTATTNANNATSAANTAAASVKILYYGSGAPSAGLGNNGDMYWRTDTAQMYGKAAGSWSIQTTISSTDANAVHKADTTLVGSNFFIDEDNMASNLATKVPSQQSVKAYVDKLRTDVTSSCRITRTSDISIAVGAYTNYQIYPFNYKITDTSMTGATDVDFSLVSSGIKVLRAGVQFIRIGAVLGTDLTGQNIQANILRNGSTIFTVDFGAHSGMASVVIPTFTTPCAVNDIFTLNFASSVAGTYLTRGARCFLDVEIVK